MAPAAQQDDEFLCDCTPRGRRANEVSNPQWQKEMEAETETGLAAGQLMACCATLSAGPAAAAAAGAAVAGDGDGCRGSWTNPCRRWRVC